MYTREGELKAETAISELNFEINLDDPEVVNAVTEIRAGDRGMKA